MGIRGLRDVENLEDPSWLYLGDSIQRLTIWGEVFHAVLNISSLLRATLEPLLILHCFGIYLGTSLVSDEDILSGERG